MPRFRVIPYRVGSRSARSLSRALNGLCLRVNGQSRFRPRLDDVVINWGNTDPPLYGHNVLNGLNRNTIRNVSNKRTFFRRMAVENNQDIIPEFWENRNDIPNDAYPIVCRTVLAGHSGEGIVIANNPEELVDAPLYVRYIKKVHEYRIHVGRRRGNDSVIISEQQKRRRIDVPDDEVNWQVRNHHNGFIYARENCDPPEAVRRAAIDALECFELDFGAVDVIWNNRLQRAFVLEINTAPGLEGTTLEDYVRYFTNT